MMDDDDNRIVRSTRRNSSGGSGSSGSGNSGGNFTPPTMPRVNGRLIGVGVTILVIAAIATSLVGSIWKSVDLGYAGVIFDKVNNTVRQSTPGWVFINPFTESLTQYPASVRTLIMVQATGEGQVAGDDSVKVNSSEGQSLQADVSVLYRVKSNEAGELYKQYAGAPIEQIESNVVRQLTRSAMNDAASRYGWEQIFSSDRITYTLQVSERLVREFATSHIELVNFNLRAWHLPQNLQAALDQKIAAQQQAEQQKYQLEQARIKADQDKVQAEGQAGALRAKADGDAYATTKNAEAAATARRTQADAETYANQKIAQSLSPQVVQYYQLTKWNGQLPMFGGGGAGSNVFLSVNPNDIANSVPTPAASQPAPTQPTR